MNKKRFISEEQREDLYKILLSGLLFICSLVIGLFFDGVPEIARIILFVIAYLISGFEILKEALENLLHLELFDEDFLMCIASIGAMALGDFAEGCAVMILFRIGELFEDIASEKSRKSIAGLMNIKPETARVIRCGNETLCLPEEVVKGETIVVYSGEKVAIDGEITDGGGNFDLSALTGESMPVFLSKGDNVPGGAVCLDNVCHIKVSGAYSESTVAKILQLVEESQNHKSKSERFIRRFSKIYTPCVIVAALAVGVALPLIFGLNFDVWVKRALTFLVVSCPCALVISVPLTFFCGIGAASRRGILIKGADALENLSKVKTAVFDKTGTLTKGEFSVTCIHPEAVSERELLDIAALAESYSNHPIALSILKAHGGHIMRSRVCDVREVSGKGIICTIDGKKICAGNASLLQSEGVKIKECSHHGTQIHISRDGEYMGHIVIADTLKDDSRTALEELKKQGVAKTVMLTGDSEAVAKDIAKALMLDEYKSQLMPEDKVDELKKLLKSRNQGETVMFVGDGINDAPALKLSDVGVAMGAVGSDSALEASDVVLTDDSPKKTATAISIARRTMRIARQNIVFSIAVKIAVLIMAAVGAVPMWMAVFADVGVMVIAVANAVRCANA